MSKRIKTYDDVMSLSRPFSRIKSENDNDLNWTGGEVVTKYGIVIVYAQGDKNYFHFTRLDFSKDGKLFMRNFKDKRYSPRYLVSLAEKFAKEVCQSKVVKDNDYN